MTAAMIEGRSWDERVAVALSPPRLLLELHGNDGVQTAVAEIATAALIESNIEAAAGELCSLALFQGRLGLPQATKMLRALAAAAQGADLTATAGTRPGADTRAPLDASDVDGLIRHVTHALSTPDLHSQASSVKPADANRATAVPSPPLEVLGDLQHVSEADLAAAKRAMDVKFDRAAVGNRPGESGFVYDKRVEVTPSKASEWDDE